MGLDGKADELARNLPYGDQRRLEIARALATSPQLLCLDEPAAGFNPAEKAKLMELIRTIRDQGYTVLLIEHDMKLVMGVTDRIVVLEFGKKIAEGVPAEIRTNPAVIAAYLGEEATDGPA
jgi:branched-chain amino acid transport system ATP-binding protein